MTGVVTPGPGWLVEGDPGGYDVVEIRLRPAGTILFLDFFAAPMRQENAAPIATSEWISGSGFSAIPTGADPSS